MRWVFAFTLCLATFSSDAVAQWERNFEYSTRHLPRAPLSGHWFSAADTYALGAPPPAFLQDPRVTAYTDGSGGQLVRVGYRAFYFYEHTDAHGLAISTYLSQLAGWDARPTLHYVPELGIIATRGVNNHYLSFQERTRNFFERSYRTSDLFASEGLAAEFPRPPTANDLARRIGEALAEWVQHTGLFPPTIDESTFSFGLAMNDPRRSSERQNYDLEVHFNKVGVMRPIRALFNAGMRHFPGVLEIAYGIAGHDEMRITDPALQAVQSDLKAGFRDHFLYWTGVDVGILDGPVLRVPRSSAALAPWIARERRACVVKALVGARRGN